MTTFVSALIHEYLLAIALGFASPMLIIEFAGLGGMFLSFYCLIRWYMYVFYPCSYFLCHETSEHSTTLQLLCSVGSECWWS